MASTAYQARQRKRKSPLGWSASLASDGTEGAGSRGPEPAPRYINFSKVSKMEHALGRAWVHTGFITAPYWHLSVTESVALPPDLQEHHVPLAYHRSDPSLLPIDRPRCPKCPGRMLLARIEPGPAHSDLRTFECPECAHVQRVLVEDPMKSATAGWQYSGLYPPK